MPRASKRINQAHWDRMIKPYLDQKKREEEARVAAEQAEARTAREIPLAFGYRRCSHDDSRFSGLGLEVQTEMVERWFDLLRAEHRKLEWGNWYVDEAVSASKRALLARPGGAMLGKTVRPGDHVIFAHLDRAFRDVQDCLGTLQMWQRRGVIVHFADMKVDMSTANGQFMITIIAAIAEWESRRISERNKAVAARQKATGRPSTHPPMGYKHVGPAGKRRRVSDPQQRQIMQEIVRVRDVAHPDWSWWTISDYIESLLCQAEDRPFHARYQRRAWSNNRCRLGYIAEKKLQKVAAEYAAKRKGAG